MGCACTKASDPAGERDGLTGAVSEAVGGGMMAAAAAAVATPRQLLEYVQDATGDFAHATVKTGELVAAATVKVASEADFMRIISKPEVPALPPVLLQQQQPCSAIALAAFSASSGTSEAAQDRCAALRARHVLAGADERRLQLVPLHDGAGGGQGADVRRRACGQAAQCRTDQGAAGCDRRPR